MSYARGPFCEPNPLQRACFARLEWVLYEAGYGELPEIRLVTGLWQKTGPRSYVALHGLTARNTIWLDACEGYTDFVETMLHETAHAVAHRAAPEEAEEHSQLWGTIYARIYSGWLASGGPRTVLRKTPIREL